jgi:hypothetical protein
MNGKFLFIVTFVNGYWVVSNLILFLISLFTVPCAKAIMTAAVPLIGDKFVNSRRDAENVKFIRVRGYVQVEAAQLKIR